MQSIVYMSLEYKAKHTEKMAAPIVKVKLKYIEGDPGMASTEAWLKQNGVHSYLGYPLAIKAGMNLTCKLDFILFERFY